jgi:hypothetical protein
MSVAGALLKEKADHFGRSPQGIGRLHKKYHSTALQQKNLVAAVYLYFHVTRKSLSTGLLEKPQKLSTPSLLKWL